VYMPFPWVFEERREFRYVEHYEKTLGVAKNSWFENFAELRRMAKEVVFIGSSDDLRRIFEYIVSTGYSKKISIYLLGGEAYKLWISE
ncbi:MAG: hypothetical protein ACK4TI_02435, partial [Nitrososphaerales archaeon]